MTQDLLRDLHVNFHLPKHGDGLGIQTEKVSGTFGCQRLVGTDLRGSCDSLAAHRWPPVLSNRGKLELEILSICEGAQLAVTQRSAG